jgi:hypothetical protein
MRLIDADANIETMKKCAENPENAQALLCYRYTQKILEEAPTVEPASPWHRVEEELPKSGEFGDIVIACNDVGTVNAAYLSSNGKWYAANNTMYDAWTWMPNVTHWMPLPEPPKEDA